MNEKLKWIIPTVMAVLFAVGFIVTLVLHLRMKEKNSITKVLLKYSTVNNTGLQSNVSIESYLVENDSMCYLFIPGKKTQNALIYKKLIGTSTEPVSINTDVVNELSMYKIDTSTDQLMGYFNNCAILQWANWTLSSGVLKCNPFVFDSSSGSIKMVNLPINLTTCGGSSIPVNSSIMSGFGASVIPLKKI